MVTTIGLLRTGNDISGGLSVMNLNAACRGPFSFPVTVTHRPLQGRPTWPWSSSHGPTWYRASRE